MAGYKFDLATHEIATTLALEDDFAGWQVRRLATSAAWIATLKRGTFTHVIAAFDAATLRGKMRQAVIEDAGRGE